MQNETNTTMNFGKWIILAFILFAGFIVTLVVICIRQDVNLVSKDYYKDELAYQKQIERLDNTLALQRQPDIRILDNNLLSIQFNQVNRVEDAKLVLFCPANPVMDKTILMVAGKDKQLIKLDGAAHGMYKARLFWTMEGKEFFVEEIINIYI